MYNFRIWLQIEVTYSANNNNQTQPENTTRVSSFIPSKALSLFISSVGCIAFRSLNPPRTTLFSVPQGPGGGGYYSPTLILLKIGR